MRFRSGVLITAVLVAPAFIGACAVQRAETASAAKAQMVGMSRERVLACMGVPAARQAEGETEVWTYGSGGRLDSFASGTSTTTASALGIGQTQFIGNTALSTGPVTGTATTSGFASSSTRGRFCVVNVVLMGGRVSAVNYSGRTGGLLTQGEQCAYAVQNCVH